MESITINNNHNYVYNTYKELNKIMPQNFLKIKVNPSKKYNFSNKKIIDTIESNYNTNKYIDKNGKPKKSIYLYSSPPLSPNNKKEKYSSKNCLSLISFHKANNSKNRNKPNINPNSTEITNKKNIFLRTKGFNSSPIKNYFLRNNICLPEITHRIKYKIPRNEREINGFKVIGNEIKFINDKNGYKFNNNMNNNYKIFGKNNKNEKYCLTEGNEKRKSFDKLKNLPLTLNIVSIYNKNKNTKLNLYNKTEEKNNSLN